MARRIQAYFRTEDDAESARTKLQTYSVSEMEIGELPEGRENSARLLAPFALGAGTTDGTVMGSGAGVSGADRGIGAAIVWKELGRNNEIDSTAEANGTDENSLKGFKYVLSCQAAEEDYDEVIDVIRRNEGAVEIME